MPKALHQSSPECTKEMFNYTHPARIPQYECTVCGQDIFLSPQNDELICPSCDGKSEYNQNIIKHNRTKPKYRGPSIKMGNVLGKRKARRAKAL